MLGVVLGVSLAALLVVRQPVENENTTDDAAVPGTVGDNSATTNANAAADANTSTDKTAGWKTYENSSLLFSIKLPPGWDVETERISKDEVVFNDGLKSENRESVKSLVTDQTVEEWIAGLEDVTSTKDYTLDGRKGKRVQVLGVGGDFVGVRNGNRLYIVTVGRMEVNGMLATFTFLILR